MNGDLEIVENRGWTEARPALSVLIPFLRDDPSVLLGRLDTEAQALDGQAELVVLDDGTGDPELTRRLSRQILEMRLPVRLITLSVNEGRAAGRNRLAQAARGQSLLFLDSDMRPDQAGFLRTWIDLATHQQPAVAFGGFSLLQAPADACYAVHRSIAAKSECLPSEQRRMQPEKYVYTSNLLVRRDVFQAETFDSGFSGWGWEDVEWAMRVSSRFPVVHIDNPATHMGLDTVETLAGKYEQSAANFGRMASRHPQIVAGYPSYKAARLLKRVPVRPSLRRLLRAAAKTAWLPVPARAFSLRLYRAALYAETV
jgi:glycosyltransferase involved in cell wall biosynthesis